MKDMMEYKGFWGSVHYSDEDRIFFGKIEFIRSLLTYEGTDITSLRNGFEETVEDYLETCKQEGKNPEISFKGTFNVRVGSQLHREATLYAQEHGMNLNTLIKQALESHLGGKNT